MYYGKLESLVVRMFILDLVTKLFGNERKTEQYDPNIWDMVCELCGTFSVINGILFEGG